MNTRKVLAELAKNMTLSGAEVTLTDEKGNGFELLCRDGNFLFDSLKTSIESCTSVLTSAVSRGMKVTPDSAWKQLTKIDHNCVVDLYSNMDRSSYSRGRYYDLLDVSDSRCGDDSELRYFCLMAPILLLILVAALIVVYVKPRYGRRDENEIEEERQPLRENRQNRQRYDGQAFRLRDGEGAAPVAVVVQPQEEQREGEQRNAGVDFKH